MIYLEFDRVDLPTVLLQVVALILAHMPADSAFRAAGISRSWRAAARSLTGLRLSFSIILHTQCGWWNDPEAHTATGWSRLRCLAGSPAAVQIESFQLIKKWEVAQQAEIIELPAGSIEAADGVPDLHLPALQQLRVRFVPPQEMLNFPACTSLAGLTTNLLAVLVRGCPQLQHLMLSLNSQHFYMGLQPLSLYTLQHDQMLAEFSPLNWILRSALPALQTVTVRETRDGAMMAVPLEELLRCSQPVNLVLQAP